LYLSGITLGTAATITNLTVYVNTAGSGLAGCRLGLYNQAGTLLAQTADLSTAFQSNGKVTASLASAYSAAAGVYYVALLIGNSSTTAPNMYALGITPASYFNMGATVASGTLAGNARALTYSSGLTSLPTTISSTPTLASTEVQFFLS